MINVLDTKNLYFAGKHRKFFSLNIVDNGFIFTPSRAYEGWGVILRARKGTFTT